MKRQLVSFAAPGLPVPGGSKRAFVIGKGTPKARAIVTDDSGKRGKEWRAVVRLAAARAMTGRPPFDGALALTVVFTLPRPKGHRTAAGRVRPSAPPFPTTRPDTTKLLRSLEDACTGVLWRDDAQIVQQDVAKFYGDRPGALVVLCALVAQAVPASAEAGAEAATDVPG